MAWEPASSRSSAAGAPPKGAPWTAVSEVGSASPNGPLEHLYSFLRGISEAL